MLLARSVARVYIYIYIYISVFFYYFLIISFFLILFFDYQIIKPFIINYIWPLFYIYKECYVTGHIFYIIKSFVRKWEIKKVV